MITNTVPKTRTWLALAVVLAAEVMDLLDATIINVAGPSIRADLHGSYAFMQWLAAGYTLAFAVGLVTGGRLGDIYGRRRMFVIGATGFTICALLCAAWMASASCSWRTTATPSRRRREATCTASALPASAWPA